MKKQNLFFIIVGSLMVITAFLAVNCQGAGDIGNTITSASISYGNAGALTIRAGDKASPDIANLLKGSDALADAVTFSITKTSGTGPDPSTTAGDDKVSIDPATGEIAIGANVGAFAATEYTVTVTGKGDYSGTKTVSVTLTGNAADASKDISGASVSYGTALTLSAGSSAAPTVTNLLEGGDQLADAVTFSMTKTSGPGPDPSTTAGDDKVSINPATGEIAIGANVGAFAATEYTVTLTGKGNYSGTKTVSVTLTGEAAGGGNASGISIRGASISYGTANELTLIAGNSAAPTVTDLLALLDGGDQLADAVTFSMEKSDFYGSGPDPVTVAGDDKVSINPATGEIAIGVNVAAFAATEYAVIVEGTGNYVGRIHVTINLTGYAAGTALYGTPAAITETTNTNGEIKLSWSEFDSDDTTEYTVYAYNLSVRTATGSTAPTLTEFLDSKTEVTQITSVMAPITDWNGLTEPNTPDSANTVSSLNLYTGTKYVFLVTGTRSNTLLTDIIAAQVIDIASNTGSDPNYYINSASGTFHVAVIEAVNISWVDAAAMASAQGGGAKLVEIESSTEQSNVEAAIGKIPDIKNFAAPADGGGASYLWIGATDQGQANEGDWVWDGDNDGTSSPLGTAVTASNSLQSWTPDSSAYHNWGEVDDKGSPVQKEPDNFLLGAHLDITAQDYAAIGLTAWTNGAQYQWNDIAGANKLSGYILEAGKDW